MARNQGEIRFGVGFNVDKSGLNELKTSLQQLQNLTVGDIVGADSMADAKRKLSNIKDTAIEVEKALAKSFNPTLNTYDIDKFNKEITKTSGGVASLGAAWVNAGASGTQAMISMASALTSIQLPLKETHNLLTSMGNTLANTIRWTIASQGINSVTGSIQKAWSFTKQLDTSLNNIRIVTEKSSEEMEHFAKQANNAAKSLGATTKSYAEAALIYYQQGLSDQEVQARAEATVKVANVTGQSADTVSEQLTAIWNGYKVSSQEAELYIDKVSAVAATTAADLEELATGMSKVASAANIMGVDIDQLNAQLATIVSVTREAPESIGTALKTVYARMSDIEAGLDTETTLGEYTSQMQALGIEALDASGNLRDQGDVIEEIGNKWDAFNRNQQVALAQIIAGTRQYSRMMALFDNWDMYEQALSTSQGSAGALQKQQDIYLDSLEAKLEKLNTTVEELYLTLFDSDSFKTLIDIASVAIKVFDTLIETVGGGGVVFSALIPIILKLTSSNIASGISTFASNFRATKNEAQLLKQALENIDIILASNQFDSTSKSIVELRKQMIELRQAGIVTNEEFNTLEQSLKEMETTANKIVANRYDKEQIKTRYTNLAKNFLSGSETNLDIDIDKALDAGAAAVNAGGVFTDAEKDDQNFQNYLHNIDSIKTSVQDQTNTIKEARKAFEQYKKSLGTDKEEADLEDLKKRLQEVDQAAKLLSGDVGDNTFLTKNEKNSVQARARNLNKAINAENFEPTTAALKKMDEQVSSLEVSYGKVSEKLNKEVIPGFKGAAKESAEGAKSLNQFNSIGARVKDTIAKWNFEERIKQLTEITAGFTSAATAIMAFQNIGSIWDSKDLSTGEKILQTITNFSIGMSALIPILNSIKTLHGLVTAAQATSTAATIAKTVATKAETDAEKENAFWKAVIELMSQDDAEQAAKITTAIMAQNGAIDANTKALLANYLAKKLNNGEKLDLGDAGKDILDSIEKNLKGSKNIKGSFKKIGELFTKHGKTIGAAFGVAIAIAGAVVVGKSLVDLYNKEKILVKKAEETAAIAKQEYDAVRSSYNELMQTITDYKEARNSIDELTHGTEEWRMAVNDLNHDVLGLMKSYQGLATFVTNEGGILTINDAGLNYLQQQKQQELNNALAAQSIATAQAAAARGDAEAMQVARKESLKGTSSSAVDNKDTMWKSIGGGALAGLGIALATLATVGTGGAAAPLIAAALLASTGAGAIAGAGISAIADSIDESEEGEKNTWKTAARLYNEDSAVFRDRESLTKAWYGADKTFQQLDKTQQTLIDSLLANTEQISILSGKLGNENSQEQIARQQAANAYISNLGLESFENSVFQGQISKAFSGTIGEAEYEAARNQRSKDNNKTNQQDYAERMGYVWISDNNNGTGTFKRRNSDGTLSEAFDLEDDFIRAANAYIDAFDASKDKLIPIINKFNKLNGALNNTDIEQQLANLASGLDVNLATLTESELQKFAEYAKEHFNILWTEMADSYTAHLEKQGSVGSNLTGAAKASFDALDLTLEGKNNLLPYYENALPGSLQVFDNFFASIGDYGDEAAELIDSFDWSQNDASTKFLEKLQEIAGINFDFKSASNFAYELEKIQGALSFNKKETQNKAQTLNEIIDSLNEIGDTISPESYEGLAPGLKEYFIEMEDGTYALIYAAHEFQKVASNIEIDELKNAINIIKGNIATQKNILETNNEQNSEAWRKYYNFLTDYGNSIGSIEDKILFREQYGGVSQNKKNKWLRTNQADNFDKFLASDAGKNYVRGGTISPNTIAGEAGKHAAQTVVDNARQQYNYLSQIKVPGTDLTYIEYLKEQGTDTDFWYKELFENNRTDRTMLGGLAITVQQAQDSYVTESNNLREGIELEKSSAEGELDKLEKNLVTAQSQLMAQAGSLENLERLAKEEYLDEDSELYKKYKEFYSNKEIQAQSKLDWSFELAEEEEAVKNLQKSIEQYSREFDNAYGEDKITALDNISKTLVQQNVKLREQIKLLKNRAQLMTTTENGELDLALGGVGLELSDLQFDNNGKISNYEQIMQTAVQNMSDSDLITEEDINTLEAAFSKYFGYYDQIENKESSIDNNIEEYYKNQVTKLNTQLNLIETRKDAIQSYNDFLRSIADENAFDSNAQSYLSDYQASIAAITDYQAQLNDLHTKDLLSADFEAQKQELINRLREEGLSAQEALAQVTQTVVDYQNAVTESYQDQVNLLENIISSYEHLISLNELVYGDKAIAKTLGYYDKINEQNKTIMETREVELAVAAGTYQDALNSGNDDLIKSTQEAYIAANQAYQDSIIAYAQSAQEAFLKATEARIAEFKGDIERYKDDWDWRKDADEDFLDEFDALTGISKVEAAYNKSLNATTSLTVQKQLKALMDEELKQLREKDKLTQYDLDRANKRLEIEQARIALEEAQQNKTKMRLTRGADGTYSYEYIADQNAIDEKRAELESLQNELVHLDEEELENSLDKAYDLYTQFLNDLEAAAADGNLSVEDLDALAEKYGERMQTILDYIYGENGISNNIAKSIADMNALIGTGISVGEIFEGYGSEFYNQMKIFAQTGIAESLQEVVDKVAEEKEEFDAIVEGANGEKGLLEILEDTVGAFETAIGDENKGMFKVASDATSALNLMSDTIWGVDGTGGVVGALQEFKQALTGEDGILNLIKGITNPDNPSGYEGESGEGLDTGGYTGSWGASGRLAVLHEKELVLNKTDTENILSAVDIIRDLQFSLDASITARLMEMMKSYERTVQAFNNATGQVIEQHVEINAEFPNATDRNEIEEAFKELLNMATQRIAER